MASVVVAAMGGTASASVAQDAPTPAAALGDAQRARQAAERRFAELTDELATLDAELAQRFVGAAELAVDLEAALSQMRSSAIAAFVDGGEADASLSLFTGADLGEISGRRTFASSRSLDWADAAAEFEALQSDNDPELVAMVARREALVSRVEAARDAVFQSNAVEADAERAVAEAAAEQAADEAAARAAEAAAAEAARQAPTTGVSKRPGAPPTTGRPPVAVPTSGPAPSSGSLVLLTEPSAPLPELGPEGPSEEAWAQVRRCESGGNYRATSRSGRYRGAYQFDQQTWEAMGGRGDPAAALPLEQDARAKLLFSKRGARAWPHCGLALL